MVQEWAQSIPHLEKPKNWRFSHKNPKMFDFRFNTPISLNQGQGSIFKVQECAQSAHKIAPKKSFVKKILRPKPKAHSLPKNFFFF